MGARVLLGILCGASFLAVCLAECGLPAVPAHATIQFDSFPVRAKTVGTYACDPGFILLGKESRMCSSNGTWTGFTPLCVVDVALGKPSKSSSQQGQIGPSIAVSGDAFGGTSDDTCHTTKPEIAPWWSVNLLESYVIHSVRLVVGQACCADGPVYIEVRVGNDRDISRNALCGRYNGILEDGLLLDVRCYRPLRGIFLSVHQLREVPNALSLCRVQAFSDQAITVSQCPIAEEKISEGDVFTYTDQCYHFFNSKPDTWDNAQMYCQRRGGSLVWGTSPAFQAFVSWSMAHRYNQVSEDNPNYWMGAMRGEITNGEWMWVKGNTTINPIRAFWSSRDPPADYNGLQSCVMFDSNSGWLWRETSCNRHLNWVCEFTPRSCGNPAVQANSTVQYSSTDVGSVAVYGCTGGLYLRGQSLRRCQPNGKWSDQPPVCTMDGCGIPTPIENGEASYNHTTVGAVAEYICAKRFKPIGPTMTRCDSEGNWDTEPPQCIMIDCGPPPSIPFGSAMLLDRATSEGSKLEYHCDADYSLVGNNRLTCSGDEVWEGEIPFCQQGGELPATFFSHSKPTEFDSSDAETTAKRTTTTTIPSTTTTESTTSTTSSTYSPTSTSTTVTIPETTTIPSTTTEITTTESTTTTIPSTTTTTPTPSTTTSTTTIRSTTTVTTTKPTTTTRRTRPTTTTSSTTTTSTTTSTPSTITTERTTTTEPTTLQDTTTVTSTSQARSSPSSRWISSTYDAFPSTLSVRPSPTWASSSTAGQTVPATIETSSSRAIPVGWDTSSTGSSASTTWQSSSSRTSPETLSTPTSRSSSSSSAATSVLLRIPGQRNDTATLEPLNGTIIFNNSDRALLEGEANQFRVFTPPPVHTSSQQPVLNGRYLANNAMLRAPDVPYPYPSSSSPRPATETSTTTLGVNETGGRGVTRVDAGSPFEDRVPQVADNEPYDGKTDNGRRRLGNAPEVISATEVIIPTVAANKGVGGWIALGVILGLLFLFLFLLILFCCIRRRRARSTRVELTSTVPVTQYDADAGTSSAVFSSRYRKAWDNLQVHVDDGKNVNVGKDTLASHTTFQSTGPRRRDDIAVKSGAELTMSPSRAGTVKSTGTMKSLGGLSEAYHGSEEILIDDAQAAPQHLPYSQAAGNSPDVIEVIPSIPRAHAV